LNIYESLDIDIPTLHGVLIEKYKAPDIDGDYMSWRDKIGRLHSFNGFPSRIVKRHAREHSHFMYWSKHGELIDALKIERKSEIERISKKIAARNFEERAKGIRKKR
jgi:hypothetical protein